MIAWGEPRTGRMRISATSAIIAIPPLELPPTIRFAGVHWLAKKEFHLTLLDRSAMEAVARAGSATALVREAAKGIELAARLTGELWMLEEPPARTLIARAELDGAAALLGRLAEAGVVIEEPPFHVTLYTLGTSRGIGIHTMKELRSLGRELDESERGELLARLTAPGA